MDKVDRIILEFVYNENIHGKSPCYIFNQEEREQLTKIIADTSAVDKNEDKIKDRVLRLMGLGYMYFDCSDYGCIVTDEGEEKITKSKEKKNNLMLKIAIYTLIASSLGVAITFLSLIRACDNTPSFVQGNSTQTLPENKGDIKK